MNPNQMIIANPYIYRGIAAMLLLINLCINHNLFSSCNKPLTFSLQPRKGQVNNVQPEAMYSINNTLYL